MNEAVRSVGRHIDAGRISEIEHVGWLVFIDDPLDKEASGDGK
jgi:hypothetical protein